MVFLDLRPVDNDRDRAGDRRTDRLSPGPMLRAISRHRLIRSCDTRTKWSNLRPAVVISAAPASGQGAQCCVVRVRRTAATTAATLLHFCPLWPELTFHTHTRASSTHSPTLGYEAEPFACLFLQRNPSTTKPIKRNEVCTTAAQPGVCKHENAPNY